MFKMKWFLVLCVLLAVTNFVAVSARPDQDHNPDYEDDEALNDDEGGVYSEDDADEDDDDDDDDALPPTIKTLSRKFKNMPGDTVSLPCETENAEAFTIMWLKDGVMLFQDKIPIGQRNSRFTRMPDQSLKIVNITVNDGGVYQCAISTSPNFTSVNHNLIVFSPAEIIKVLPKNGMTEIAEGGILDLECMAEGNPKPKISWSKEGSRLNKRMEGSSVIFENVGRSDAGFYQCMADNKIGEPSVKGVQIVVTHPPDVKIETMIINSTDLHLICIVHAVPKADVHWFKDDVELKESGNVKLEHAAHDHRYTVKITKSEEANFGNYICKASNKFKHVEKNVHVTGRPTIPQFISHKFVGDDNAVMLEWNVESMLPITEYHVQYRKKDKGSTWVNEKPDSIPESTNSLYNIVHTLKDLSAGVYEARLRVKNKFGWSVYSHAISLEGKTEEPLKLSKNGEEEPYNNASGASALAVSTLSLLSAVVLSFYSKFV